MNLETSLATRFSADYRSAREKFLAAAALAGGALRSYPNPLSGPQGEELAADAAWFGPAEAAKVLVTLSATHGVEGFCGSGAQLDWLLGPGTAPLPSGSAMLFVHAINPHGFAWLRRVTEEGCDLNRNFVDFAKPLPENPGYDELADAIVPRELDGPVFEAAMKRLADYRARHGDRPFNIARSGGQYRHPGGTFYGGLAPTWARRTLAAIIADHGLADRKLVAVVALISPTNKDRPGERRAFAANSVAYLQQGVSVVVIDIVTSKPFNLHNEVLELLEVPLSAAMPGDQTIYAVSYRPALRESKPVLQLWLEPLVVGQPVPTMPVPLTEDLFVPVEFESTYLETCRRRRLI